VELGGVEGDVEAEGDLLVGQALAQEGEDLPLAGRQDIVVARASTQPSHAMRLAGGAIILPTRTKVRGGVYMGCFGGFAGALTLTLTSPRGEETEVRLAEWALVRGAIH